MARGSWYLTKLARLVMFYAATVLVCAAIYIVFGGSLTQMQLYVVSFVTCLAILIPIVVLANRALKAKPNRYGRDVE
jgi:hypothetical protein